jgi:hypothetical protein
MGRASRGLLAVAIASCAVTALGACASLSQLSSGGPGGSADARADAKDGTAPPGDSRAGSNDGSAPSDATSDTSPPDDTSPSADTSPSTPCSCAPEAPAGWTGPFVLYDGPTAGAPSCPAGTLKELTAFADLQAAGPVVCSACNCQAPTNADCEVADLDLVPYTDQGCTAACSQPATILGCTTCALPSQIVLFPGVESSGTPTVTLVDAGSCTPSGGAANAPPFTGATEALGCASTGTGCDAGSVCLPAAVAPFEPHACVSQLGATSCPAGPFQTALSFFTGISDNRGCAPCACDTPQGGTCALQGFGYGQFDCNGLGMPIALGPVCSSGEWAAVAGKGVGQGGTCNASGGQPIGDAGPSGPVLVCCTP